MSRAMKESGSRGGWTLPGTGQQRILSPASSPEGKALAIHELIVELGDRLYRVERPFGSWPLNTGFVTDVAVDPRGHVFVMLRHDPLVHPNDPRVIELAPDGAYLRGWGGDLIADSHMLTADATGRILAVDRDMHEVIICSPAGERLGGLGQRGVQLAPFTHPTDVHVSAWGEIYVSDGYAASLVHRFDAAGTLIATWGSHGSGDGQFGWPHAIWTLRTAVSSWSTAARTACRSSTARASTSNPAAVSTGPSQSGAMMRAAPMSATWCRACRRSAPRASGLAAAGRFSMARTAFPGRPTAISFWPKALRVG